VINWCFTKKLKGKNIGQLVKQEKERKNPSAIFYKIPKKKTKRMLIFWINMYLDHGFVLIEAYRLPSVSTVQIF
jgi:hypothetical protein